MLQLHTVSQPDFLIYIIKKKKIFINFFYK
jgi:hypothetical protein